jgi:hypothetical protein
MKAVHVLVGKDAVGDGVGVKPLRQRELNENSIDGIVGVEAIQQPDEFGGSRTPIEPMQATANAHFRRGLFLVADINLARGIVADEHDIEARWTAMLRDEPLDLPSNFAANRFCECLAVENASRHGALG